MLPKNFYSLFPDAVLVVIVWQMDFQLLMQSVSILNKYMESISNDVLNLSRKKSTQILRKTKSTQIRRTVVFVIAWQLYLQLPMQLVPITTDVVSSNLDQGEVYKNYVIKLVSDLRQVRGFSPGLPVSSTNKADRHDVTEILLKVALNTKQFTFSKITVKYNENQFLTYRFGIFIFIFSSVVNDKRQRFIF